MSFADALTSLAGNIASPTDTVVALTLIVSQLANVNQSASLDMSFGDSLFSSNAKEAIISEAASKFSESIVQNQNVNTSNDDEFSFESVAEANQNVHAEANDSFDFSEDITINQKVNVSNFDIISFSESLLTNQIVASYVSDKVIEFVNELNQRLIAGESISENVLSYAEALHQILVARKTISYTAFMFDESVYSMAGKIASLSIDAVSFSDSAIITQKVRTALFQVMSFAEIVESHASYQSLSNDKFVSLVDILRVQQTVLTSLNLVNDFSDSLVVNQVVNVDEHEFFTFSEVVSQAVRQIQSLSESMQFESVASCLQAVTASLDVAFSFNEQLRVNVRQLIALSQLGQFEDELEQKALYLSILEQLNAFGALISLLELVVAPLIVKIPLQLIPLIALPLGLEASKDIQLSIINVNNINGMAFAPSVSFNQLQLKSSYSIPLPIKVK